MVSHEKQRITEIWTHGPDWQRHQTVARPKAKTPPLQQRVVMVVQPPDQDKLSPAPVEGIATLATKPTASLTWLVMVTFLNFLVCGYVSWVASNHADGKMTAVLEKLAGSISTLTAPPPPVSPAPAGNGEEEAIAAKHLSMAVNVMSDEVVQLREQVGQLRNQVKGAGGELDTMSAQIKATSTAVTPLDLFVHNRALFPTENGREKLQQAGSQTKPNKTTQNQ